MLCGSIPYRLLLARDRAGRRAGARRPHQDGRPARLLCCGLTWISTGPLDTAQPPADHEALTELREDHPDWCAAWSPSCTAVLRSDAVDLLGGGDDQPRGSSPHQVQDPGRVPRPDACPRPGAPPDLGGVEVLAQPPSTITRSWGQTPTGLPGRRLVTSVGGLLRPPQQLRRRRRCRGARSSQVRPSSCRQYSRQRRSCSPTACPPVPGWTSSRCQGLRLWPLLASHPMGKRPGRPRIRQGRPVSPGGARGRRGVSERTRGTPREGRANPRKDARNRLREKVTRRRFSRRPVGGLPLWPRGLSDPGDWR